MNLNTGIKFACLALAGLVLHGCASLPTGPVEPTITFVNFKSIQITPDGLNFEVKMRVRNNMGMDLPIQKLDYRFDINNLEFLTGSYDQLNTLRGGQEKEVIIPFMLTWQALANQALSQERGHYFRAAFKGSVSISGDLPFSVIPFEISRLLPIPKIPTIEFAGTEGNPFSGVFSVNLRLINNNDFPLSLKAVKTTLVMNNTRYDLLASDDRLTWESYREQIMTLSMNNTPEKGISFLGNILGNRGQMDLQLKGLVTFESEFGDWEIPFTLSGKSN